MRKTAATTFAATCSLTLAAGLNAAGPETRYPLKIPAPGGEVILPDARAKENHDAWRCSSSRR